MGSYLPMLMQSNYLTAEEQIAELKVMNYEDLQLFRSQMVSNFRFTSFITGNVLREQAESLTNQIQGIFHESTNDIRM